MMGLAYACAVGCMSSAPVSGKRIRGSNDVAGIGMASVIHQEAIQVVQAKTIKASRSMFWGGPMSSNNKKMDGPESIGNILRHDFKPEISIIDMYYLINVTSPDRAVLPARSLSISLPCLVLPSSVQIYTSETASSSLCIPSQPSSGSVVSKTFSPHLE